ncbi:type I polyketide synthase [Paraburkholderia bryophila]|uniref:Acyl transferase domain-containing protein/acyl carrier protein n=1 Tax=Paraburkholderia bryophila TaxID=420952 RepID=A0A7Y9WB00_9BURK|nr:type I polyketide synthase [Paraburkholderia bryophila]NYH17070.1 acyl transferase domain-containing protein/acyl carrier protein [Paraburkholderia bryophila]
MTKQIAIVGMACRFPGHVESPDDFWALLRDEKDAVTQVPADRFGTEFYQHPSKREAGKSYTFSAGVLDDVAGFDAAFFGISPREAQQMDPQQRLLLELAWETFEDAGVRPRDMEGSHCAVYIGVASPDYGNRFVDDLNAVDPYSATGNTLSIASNRLSYLFDLRGPSVSVDTACSSSLVALHQACQALQSGDAEIALAGGVNLLLHPFGFVTFSKASMLSPRGRCRAFDASGDGYVRSEGGALVMLKTLDRALADGDTIHAVIAGSGVNSDGYSQGGISVPGAATQAALLRTVYDRAGVDPRSLAYVEAHGTGTAVGDPIEARALMEVASAGREVDRPLLIGSVKTNVGHLETASGMAGLIKAILCLKHRAVPKTLHFETPNPAIDFVGGRLRVVDRLTPLGSDGQPLVIGVNSFGFGGTNAHVVLKEAPGAVTTAPAAGDNDNETRTDNDSDSGKDNDIAPLPLILSARSAAALPALAARYLAALENGTSWNTLASNAAHRRQWLKYRAVIAPATSDEAHAALGALIAPTPDQTTSALVQGDTPGDDTRLALVFSGNGSQWAGMGKQLLEQEPVFSAALDELDALWCTDGSPSLVAALREGVSATLLEATEHAQPLLFALQVGVVRVIEARGVGFDVCLGHSVGEVAAAWASGALTLAQAVHVIKIRSGAQAATRGTGRMAAAGLGETAMRALLAQLGVDTDVEVAGVNSPQAVTLAGPFGALQRVEVAVKESGRFFQMLDLDYAFHSRQMNPIEPGVLQGLADLTPGAATRRFVSTVTGAELAGTELDAHYWWRNIREPVRFGEAVAQVAQTGVRLFLEVGPHSILRTYVTQTLDDVRVSGRSLPTLKRHHDSARMLQQAIHATIANGARVDAQRFAPMGARVALPSYPWQHERYWLGPTAEAYNLVNRRREHPLLGYRLHEHALAWENQLDPGGLPMLADHVVDGGVAFPGAGYVEMALAAARVHFGTASCAVENLEIRLPVVFQPQHSKLFRFTVDVRTASFTIETRDRMSDEAWSLNVTGRLLASGCALSDDAATSRLPATALTDLFARPAMSGDTLYANTTAIGLTYGPAFQWVRSVHVDADADIALAEVDVPAVLAQSPAELDAYALHPALMDSGFHPLFALLAAADQSGLDHAAYVPVQLGRIDYLRGDAIRYVLARIERRSPHSVVASFEFADAQGAIVARLGACRFRRVDLKGRRQQAPARYTYLVEAKPLAADIDSHTLPEPAALLVDAVAALAAREDQPRRRAHLTEMLPLLDVLAGSYALQALDALKVFEHAALPDCAHPTLLARLAQIAVEDGLVTRDGARLVRDDVACANLPGIDELWRELIAQSPAHVAELTLLAHCGAALPAVLRGEVSGARILPPSRSSLVEHFFEASPTWTHVNALAGECLHRAIEGWNEPRRLRVLELDSPSSDVLQPLAIHVPVSRCDYTIAGTHEQLSGFDASGHPSVHIATIEFGETPRLSGVEVGERYDLVVASHVLAAQTEPRALLAALRGWLAPGALVVVTEPRNSRFADIVFDLDADAAHANARRAAWLSPQALTKQLEAAGFEQVTRHAEQGLDLEGAPTLIVAREPLTASRTADASDVASQAAQARPTHWSLLYAAESGDSVLGADTDTLAAALQAAGHSTSTTTLLTLRHDMSKLAAPAGHVHHVVFISPDHSLSANADGADVMLAQQQTTLALAQLVRDLTAVAGIMQPQLWIVTRGGAPLATPFADAAMLRPEQAAMWGLGRVLANEHPELSSRLIDVCAGCRDAGALLARELLASDGEEEVLLTPHGRYVPRMLPAASAALRDKDAAPLRAQNEAAVLGFASPGSLRNLEWFGLPQRELAPDEVEIEPVATGLNFRDVMYAMGLLSDEAVENGFAGATIGMELSGRVARVGRDVARFVPGDAVLGFAPASFASHVWTKAEAIAHKPARLTFEEAATVPTTFFTAYYALCELARLRRGERVLVHGAAGGVGIAAIQLARHLGAEVFATAGSREKREFVRLLGADHVFDSRSLAFADEIRERTQGAGVDIVLNSLAGEAMVRSIDTLRPFGRFLELGKRDFYENSRIGLRPFRNNISYFGIDADQLMSALPGLTARLFDEVMQLFADGVLHPLPYRAFPAERVEEAFRHMQQARQIGKILVTYPAGTPSPARASSTEAALQLDPAAAYLIVGGTGGLGFATARWMRSRGARHLTLASRSGSLTPAFAEEAARWSQENGTQVHAAACDVTDAAALDLLLTDIGQRGTPLKGVLHSAMVIDDGLVRNLDDARFAAVLAPKLAGAWNLHQATRSAALDFFVVYSSATTFLGNPGQSSYVAANSFLEALIVQRRAAGLAGTYMAWGPLDDVGFLARNAETREALQARIGGLSITSTEALHALERALVDVNAGEAVVRLDWQALSLGMPAARARRYTELHARGSHEPARQGGAQMRDQIAGLPFADALHLVEETLQAQIARILHMSPEKIETGRSILDMGMDSLMGMELGMAVEESFQVKLSIMTMAEGATVHSLAQRIVESIQTQDDAADNGVAAQVAAVAAQHALDVGAHALADVADAMAAQAGALSASASASTSAPSGVTTELV